MRNRKSKDLSRALESKGFVKASGKAKAHHNYYYLHVDGKKTHIYTYISHNGKDYSPFLMASVKKQLKFTDNKKAEDYFDCTLSEVGYIDMLKESREI